MDSFGAAAIRERVLTAWAASPARFREDANAEEELVRGAYRDRVVIELAQNAADAAARAGVDGALLIRVDDDALTVANTGTALDAAGVEALSTLRASAKRAEQGAVGRFGVGFASVLVLSDAPAVFSSSGGVRWSQPESRAALEAHPELTEELARRGGALPVLRLPFAVDDVNDAGGLVPAGFDTAVVLPFRDAAARDLARRLVAGIDDALLLSLDVLRTVTIEVDGAVRTITAGPTTDDPDTGVAHKRIGERRWRLARRTGSAAAELLADRPSEERARPWWTATVAVPVTEAGAPDQVPAAVPRVLHAPTPTDDRTLLPVLVVASFPLDSSRRRVAPGPLTDALVGELAAAYATLVASFDAPEALTLVPQPLGTGDIDTALHRTAVQQLRETAFVPTPGGGRLRPTEVVLVDGLRGAVDPRALSTYVAGLPEPAWARADILRRLEARELPLADLVDELAALRLEPTQWRAVYAALDGADPDALGALPVPLIDGRVVRGPRGVLLAGDVASHLLEPFELRVADPEAVHPLLRRLGAVEASAATVLRDPHVRAAVEAAQDAEDEAGATAVTDAVLDLVAAAGLGHDDLQWLATLPLVDASGAQAPAADLLFPDSPLVDFFDAEPDELCVDARLLERFGADVLRAVGVRDGWALVRGGDTALDEEFWHDLDDEDSWADDVLDSLPESAVPPVLADFVAVRDLDLVRDDRWPEALANLATDPDTRAAIVAPSFVVVDDGSRRRFPSYSAWWIRRHARVDGFRLDELCLADAPFVVAELFHPARLDVDPALAAAVGVVRTLTDASAEALLARLGDASVELGAHTVAAVYAELAQRPADTFDPPARLRVADGSGSRVVDAGDVVVVDGPQWLALNLGAVIVGDPDLARALDIRLASETVDATLPADGAPARVPPVVRDVLPEAPAEYVEHDELLVGGVSVDWWVEDDVVHAATPDGLARGLAWVCGRWERRWLLAEALRAPDALPVLLAEDEFSPVD